MAKAFFRFLLVSTSVAFAYGLLETGYRIIRYRSLHQQYCGLMENGQIQGNAPDFSTFDSRIGFRYRSAIQVNETPTTPCLSPRRWRTNKHGHIADGDYPVPKPPDEFRIAAIGDSFTAGITNSVRWPAVLEQQLNSNADWRRLIGKRTRVLNFGLDGIGAVQFKAVFEHEAIRFEPDLVLVSLIIDDLPRKPYYRGLPDPKAKQHIPTFVEENILAPLPWLGFYPELLASLGVSRHLRLKPRLEPQFARYFDSADESMAASLESLEWITRRHADVVVLHHPVIEEYQEGLPPWLAELENRLYKKAPQLHIIRMAEHLPVPNSAENTPQRWYQIPADRHPSDEGMRIYGESVAAVLLKRRVRP